MNDTPIAAGTEELDGAALEATFVGFFHRHHDEVLTFLSRREADRQLVEEVAQDAFMAARQKWSRIRSFDKPVAWVLRVARNILCDRQRARGRLATVPLEEDTLHEPAVVPASPLEADELLASWLRRLPPRHGEVFALFLDQWSDREIGQMLGLAYTTVRTYKAEAREKLRQLAEQDGFTNPAGRRRR